MGYCSLRVTVPPPVEPVSIDDAMTHLRLDTDEPALPAYLAAARGWAEQYLNRALITQTLCYTLSPSQPPAVSFGGLINPIIFVLPLTFWPVSGQPIDLPMSPVQAITGVTQRYRDGTIRTLAAGSDYFADPSNEPGRVTLQSISQGIGTDLSVTYRAGYGDTAQSVPVSIVHAIKLLVGFFYEHRGDDDAAEPPPAVKMLLNPYRLVTFA